MHDGSKIIYIQKKMMGLGPVISQDVSINESVADLSALDLVVV